MNARSGNLVPRLQLGTESSARVWRADAVLRSLQTFGSNCLRAAQEQTVAKELAFPDVRRRALGPIDSQLQTLFEIRRHRRQHAFARRWRLHVDVAVV